MKKKKKITCTHCKYNKLMVPDEKWVCINRTKIKEVGYETYPFIEVINKNKDCKYREGEWDEVIRRMNRSARVLEYYWDNFNNG